MTDPTTPPADEPITPSPADDAVPLPAAPPAPPVYSGTEASTAQNGMGTAALVMGILQFFCLGTIGSILAIIFGKIGMNKAKQGLATNGGSAKAGFWLGIVGVVLSLIGIVIAVVVIGFGVKITSEALDPAQNSQTGLADGNYGMEPNSSVHINDKCSFGGTPVNTDTAEQSASSVTVVGQGLVECGSDMGTPDAVWFTVTGGVAKIVEVG